MKPLHKMKFDETTPSSVLLQQLIEAAQKLFDQGVISEVIVEQLLEIAGALERERKKLAEAVIPLEGLCGQIRHKPYKEMTKDFQEQLLVSLDSIRGLLFDGINQDTRKGS